MSGEGAYVSTREAAEMLGISLRTAQLWVEQGALLAWKTNGGHRRILVHSVDKILEERRKITSIDPNQTGDEQIRIAIVEDDRDLGKLLEMAIIGFNINAQIQIATDGFSGLVMIGQFKPHIVIADLNMPNMDGFRMLKAIQGTEFTPDKVIVATALSQNEIASKGGLPEGVMLLEKPFSLDLLETLIKS